MRIKRKLGSLSENSVQVANPRKSQVGKIANAYLRREVYPSGSTPQSP